MDGNLPSHRTEGEQPNGRDIYDMGSYVRHMQTPMMPNRGNTPRRNFRQRPRLLRPGLEGYRRKDNMEEMANSMGSTEASGIPRGRYDLPVDNIEMVGAQDEITDTNILLKEERPIIPLHKGQFENDPGLETIDRRPGRPTFHHQGPMNNNGMGMRPFGRRRFRNPSAMQMRQGLGTPQDQLATESRI
eukprot:TRINITY_DN32811_c0_g1_i1.p1 TRINITY_DN32811_c0_g1~~TRINITY_DN32811_c0_g1_i1.p1  ORF type:complete len:207 (+),score=28.73 TRINITY_DN32811_c0_g1_i1:58-621(+)